MSKSKKTITKHDMIRAIRTLMQHSQVLSARLDDVDRVVGDYIEFKKEIATFGEYLDGKYKQEERKSSRGNSADGKKWFNIIWQAFSARWFYA